MATKHFCDGCDAEIEGEPKVVGHVIKRDYCPTCAEDVAAYVAEVDQLHEQLAREWAQSLKAIRIRHQKTVAALPDVSE